MPNSALGVEIDESFGGCGGSFADLAAMLPVFGQSLVVEPLIPTLVLGAGLIAQHGTPAQRMRLLPSIADGTLLAVPAHDERQARNATAWVTSSARRTGQGWVLDGAKSVVLGGDTAGIFLISARTGGSADDATGISLFVRGRG